MTADDLDAQRIDEVVAHNVQEHGENVAVSVLCTTYNEVDYVAQMLAGVLAQRTTFSIEILVHDDASTDGTVEVLREYERAFPDRIRLLLEDHNRYEEFASRGYVSWLMAPLSRGRYVALCEGDDCWTDPFKLQRQYDYMEAHPTCSECVHNALRTEATTGVAIDVSGMGDEARDLTASQVIREWNVPTASRFIRKDLLVPYAQSWVFDKPASDFPLAVYLASCGYTHHDPMVASVYRYRRPGSYSHTTLSEAGVVQNALRWLVMLSHIDERTNGEYHCQLMQQALPYARIVVGRKGEEAACVGMGIEAVAIMRAEAHARQEQEQLETGETEEAEENEEAREADCPAIGRAACARASRTRGLHGHAADVCVAILRNVRKAIGALGSSLLSRARNER